MGRKDRGDDKRAEPLASIMNEVKQIKLFHSFMAGREIGSRDAIARRQKEPRLHLRDGTYWTSLVTESMSVVAMLERFKQTDLPQTIPGRQWQHVHFEGARFLGASPRAKLEFSRTSKPTDNALIECIKRQIAAGVFESELARLIGEGSLAKAHQIEETWRPVIRPQQLAGSSRKRV
jgi:hypothetical protein